MIKIVENEDEYDACNVCLSREDKVIHKVEFHSSFNHCTTIRLCTDCLKNLQEEIEETLRKALT